jgi:cytoskeletal protein CcmA (bactofilin family)
MPRRTYLGLNEEGAGEFDTTSFLSTASSSQQTISNLDITSELYVTGQMNGPINIAGQFNCDGQANFNGQVNADAITVSGQHSVGQLNVAGQVNADGEVNVYGVLNANDMYVTGNATTQQTTFTQNNEFVTKQYVDNMSNNSGNKQLIDLTNQNESAYLSQLTGISIGVENVLYAGEYITVKSSITASAGRVMSFESTVGEYTINFCNGNTGEQYASSQALGILMDDVTAGNYCRIAVKGICSVLVGSNTTAQLGCMVTLGGSASSYEGRVVCTSRTSNEPSVGICMSSGSKSINDPIVVFLQTTFESY